MQIKFFQYKKSFKKKSISASPELFWHLLLTIALLIILGSAVFGFFLFMKVNQESVFNVEDSGEKLKTTNKERIDKVLDYFSARAEKSNQILNSPSSIIDPSL